MEIKFNTILQKIVELENKFITLQRSRGSSTLLDPITGACLTNIEKNKQSYQGNEDYDGVFISPLSEEFHNFPLPPDLKAPKFNMLSGEQDPK